MSELATTLSGAEAADATLVADPPRPASGVRRRAPRPPAGAGEEGPFRLVRELGRGGMGVVWLAHHLRLGVPCALKFLGPSAGGGLTERDGLLREVTMAYRASGPNVVRVLDHGRWDGRPYLAMELLEGEDLARRLRRVGRLDARATWAIVRQTAAALAQAHRVGVVHRDLKPSNLFLAREGDTEVVKVLDFGIADWLGRGEGRAPSLTPALGPTSSNLVGTPHYMSPEQAEGLRVDGRSDLWSLAVLAFECLTGSHPFRGGSLGELLLKVLLAPLPTPSSRLPSLPSSFDAWWARATSRDRAARFADA
ncbi:MAG: serine/threonine protein kinase, partial [Polyangiaceae bacterium]|nr:serine/threonine protein kinase [Polyangiaceae bacterium]